MNVLYFLKENSYNITRLFVYQFGMTVFGLSLSMAANTNYTLLLITSIFSAVFFLYLVYSSTWEIGAKDSIRIEAGRLLPRPALGLCISLCAGIPNYILLLLSLIGFIFGSGSLGINADWAIALFTISHMIFKLLNGMYIGIIEIICQAIEVPLMSWQNVIFCFLTIVPALTVGGIGYYIGSKGKTILSLIGIKK